MDDFFQVHNQHVEGAQFFKENDPQLKRLSKLPLIWLPPIVEELLNLKVGIYTLSGGRQIGKSTLLKQWILKLLESGKQSESILYLSGELIDSHKELVILLREHISKFSGETPLYIICDEVTYIKNWDQGVKFLADAAELDNVVLMLSGSDSSIIKEARNRFPGRRGGASKTDFHCFPLSFSEVIQLYGEGVCREVVFEYYLLHGGFLKAINDFSIYGSIPDSTYNIYTQWILGDMQKKGKQEGYVLEILGAIIKRFSTQVSWNSLAKDLSIDHHKTVHDYILLLSDFDIVFIQSALLEDKLIGAPKKAKKLFFKDPFIFHAVNSLVKNRGNSSFDLAVKFLSDPSSLGNLVEQVAVCHVERKHMGNTFYIKAEGEVDIAYVDQKTFWPIEVKWCNQIRAKDIKQIRKYSNGEIWGKASNCDATPIIYSLIDRLSEY